MHFVCRINHPNRNDLTALTALTSLETTMNHENIPPNYTGLAQGPYEPIGQGHLETYILYQEGVVRNKYFTLASVGNALGLTPGMIEGRYSRARMALIKTDIPSRTGRPVRGFEYSRLENVVHLLKTPGSFVMAEAGENANSIRGADLYPLVPIEVGGKAYYTVQALAMHFDMTPPTIRSKLRKSGLWDRIVNLGSGPQGGRPTMGFPISMRGKLKLAIVDGHPFRNELDNMLVPNKEIMRAEKQMDDATVAFAPSITHRTAPHSHSRSEYAQEPVPRTGRFDRALDAMFGTSSEPVNAVNRAPSFGNDDHEPQVERVLRTEPSPDSPFAEEEINALVKSITADMPPPAPDIETYYLRPKVDDSVYYLKPHEIKAHMDTVYERVMGDHATVPKAGDIRDDLTTLSAMAKNSVSAGMKEAEQYMFTTKQVEAMAEQWIGDWLARRDAREPGVVAVMDALVADLNAGAKPHPAEVLAASYAFQKSGPYHHEIVEFQSRVLNQHHMVREFRNAIKNSDMEQTSIFRNAKAKYEALVEEVLATTQGE